MFATWHCLNSATLTDNRSNRFSSIHQPKMEIITLDLVMKNSGIEFSELFYYANRKELY